MEVDRLRYSKVKGVVIDTNMFLVPYQLGIDVLEEIRRLLPGIRVYTIPPVLREIKRLSESGNTNERLAARIGLKIAEQVEVLSIEGDSADRVLLELAKKGFIVATNDRELRRKIREAGGLTVFVRKRDHLEVG